jgi:hypothetical protein
VDSVQVAFPVSDTDTLLNVPIAGLNWAKGVLSKKLKEAPATKVAAGDTVNENGSVMVLAVAGRGTSRIV